MVAGWEASREADEAMRAVGVRGDVVSDAQPAAWLVEDATL